MQKLSFDYSLKNIPLSVLKRMRWKAHFFLSKENQQPEILNTYGFKSRNHQPQITLLEEFEEDLYGIATSIKYRNVNSNFQEKLK